MKEKVRICGQTGSGKSSFLLVLFCILEATEGRIEIDGVDISKIGLRNCEFESLCFTVLTDTDLLFPYTVRSTISIVPQSPDLFKGTL